MRFLVFSYVILSSFSSFAQQVNQNTVFDYQTVKEQYDKNSSRHTAFKPSYSDSLKGFLGLTKLPENLPKLFLRPLIDFSFSAQNQIKNNNRDAGKNLAGIGVGTAVRYVNKKWNSGFAFLFNTQQYSDYQHEFISNNRVVPGMSIGSIGKSDFTQSNYVSAYVNFSPNEYFKIETGFGRNFIGDGYRSLLLSDAANASPYLKLQTKFWKIQYSSLFSSHRNIYNVEGRNELYDRKFTATHFLDWKATKWLSVGLFETIIWGAQEGNYSRGFDPNYANPFIFYRPVEFSVGSSDNALVGANLKFSLGKNHVIYSQLVFDEFLLDELKADFNQWRNPEDSIRSGWWANKYGLQLGWTTFDLFKINGLQTRVEFNVVRPYTFAHSNPTQAYSNDNISLAHPLGANFYEFIARVNYEMKRWNFSINYHQNKQGVSSFENNVGENLQISNEDVKVNSEYENEIAQGTQVFTRYTEASASYLISIKTGTTLSASFINRDEIHSNGNSNNKLVMLRIHSNLFNKYFDY